MAILLIFDDNSSSFNIDEDGFQYISPTLESIMKRKFLLVRFLSSYRWKKKEFRYVWMVNEILKGKDIEVQSMPQISRIEKEFRNNLKLYIHSSL